MALWRFVPPTIDVPYWPAGQPVALNPWTRGSYPVSSAVVQYNDLTWAQFDLAIPQTIQGANKHYFDGSGFAAMGSDQSGWVTPRRLYLGKTYIIDDTLRAELLAAVTTQFPTGYGSLVTAAPGGSTFTGDEMMSSGSAGTGFPAVQQRTTA